ncbi:MAG TPA: hypothetical protein V6C57_01135 [Coleofasciculaceae cyanobacterium]
MPNSEDKLKDVRFVDEIFATGKSYATSKVIFDPTTLFAEASKLERNRQDSEIAATTFRNFVFPSEHAYTKTSSEEVFSNELYASATLNQSPNPEDDPCYTVLLWIVKLGLELESRYLEMQRDRYNLYNLRRLESNPVIFVENQYGETINPGSYQGYQKFYEDRRKDLEAEFETYDDNNCDDNDADYYGSAVDCPNALVQTMHFQCKALAVSFSGRSLYSSGMDFAQTSGGILFLLALKNLCTGSAQCFSYQGSTKMYQAIREYSFY